MAAWGRGWPSAASRKDGARPVHRTVIALLALAAPALAQPLAFEHHFVNVGLPITDSWIGDYGVSVLMDVDGNGKLDYVVGRRGLADRGIQSVLYWFEYRETGEWPKHILGYDALSGVGSAALDVDGGRPDLVTNGAWYRCPANPLEQEFERHVYDESYTEGHDLVIADLDGNGRPDVVSLRQGEDGLRWYEIPADPTQPWNRHIIGEGIHGAIYPGGIADIDGDGDQDIARGDTWFENTDGAALTWTPHQNIPFGRVGPYGMCLRSAFADMDGDGRQELVALDADIVDSKAAIIENVDGKGGAWERTDLPQSFTYGSLHSMAVADMDADGRLDIVSNEQEELFPEDRKDPRFVVWRNLGDGRFEECIILDKALGGHELQVADVDGDGRLDICSKAWGPVGWNGAQGQMHVDYLRNVTPVN